MAAARAARRGGERARRTAGRSDAREGVAQKRARRSPSDESRTPSPHDDATDGLSDVDAVGAPAADTRARKRPRQQPQPQPQPQPQRKLRPAALTVSASPRPIHVPKPATPIHAPLPAKRAGALRPLALDLSAANASDADAGSSSPGTGSSGGSGADARAGAASPHAHAQEPSSPGLARTLSKVELGPFELDVWFFSPYPEPLMAGTDRLCICERCFAYFRSRSQLRRHAGKCAMRAPPGPRVYADAQGREVFCVDGRANREYCQNLCLFCKLFLDQKTLFYDVHTFRFYVMLLRGAVVGYFSKEAEPNKALNLACILTFPQFQGRGIGKFLISVSYELSKQAGRVGSPEKPLSDYGLITYRSYWRAAVLDWLLARAERGGGLEVEVHDDDEEEHDDDDDDDDDEDEDGDDDEEEEEEEKRRTQAKRSRGKAPRARRGAGDAAAAAEASAASPAASAGTSPRTGGAGAVWVSLRALSRGTGICLEDIKDTLQHNQMLLRFEGQTLVALRKDLLDKHLASDTRAAFCDPACLIPH